jgi:tRNA U34 5-carboxymethylaminomethyl modifying enzyme MnmG/GidA
MKLMNKGLKHSIVQIGAARRIPGVTPIAILQILQFLRRRERAWKATG